MNSTVTNSVISFFLVMLVGIYGSKRKIITDEINAGLSEILVRICLPLLILSSFLVSYDEQVKINVYKSFLYSSSIFLLAIILSHIFVLPVKGEKKEILHFANIFTNTGFMGIPLLQMIYGTEGVIYGASYNVIFNLLLWTYGLSIFKGSDKQKQESVLKKVISSLMNSSILALSIGLIILTFSLKVPEVIASTTKLVGGVTGPLSMLIVGVYVSKINFREYLKDWTVLYGILTKLIIIPVVAILISKLLWDINLILKSILIQAAMPTAALGSIFAQKYDKLPDYTTVLIMLITICSVVTIPIVIAILG